MSSLEFPKDAALLAIQQMMKDARMSVQKATASSSSLSDPSGCEISTSSGSCLPSDDDNDTRFYQTYSSLLEEQWRQTMSICMHTQVCFLL